MRKPNAIMFCGISGKLLDCGTSVLANLVNKLLKCLREAAKEWVMGLIDLMTTIAARN